MSDAQCQSPETNGGRLTQNGFMPQVATGFNLLASLGVYVSVIKQSLNYLSPDIIQISQKCYFPIKKKDWLCKAPVDYRKY